ncbi:MAG: carbohydrate kinase [Alphaproteobacteria bacterium]|nr:carbohydrate kinase [Alphaproteobacteria bacterium]
MLLSCGDALIDFVPTIAADGRAAMIPLVGGSCLNVAIAIARLGAPAGFVGGISQDIFGCMIADHASRSGVELRYVTRSERHTTLAFARMVSGQPHYFIYDGDTASQHWMYRRGSIPFDSIEAIHVGSTTLVNDRCASETLALIAGARGKGTICFDPNCRPDLVRDHRAYVARMNEFIAEADIVRMSDADFTYLYGTVPYHQIAEKMLEQGTSLVVITRGPDGVIAWHRGVGQIEITAAAIDVVDTIGAGDSFQAALLFALRAQGRLSREGLAVININELRRVLSFATNYASLTCTRSGVDPPWSSEVISLSRGMSG